MIKLLWDMRKSGWNIEYHAYVAVQAGESTALKGGYVERRIMAYCYAGQFNNLELVRQIMNLFSEWSVGDNGDTIREQFFLRNVSALESQFRMSFNAFRIQYDPDYFKLVYTSAMRKVSWAI